MSYIVGVFKIKGKMAQSGSWYVYQIDHGPLKIKDQ